MMAIDMAIDESSLWDAVLARDARHDGEFFYGVTTTGVFCRPSCPSRRPKRENVIFMRSPGEAARAGLRPCRRCRPLGTDPAAQRVTDVCRHIERNLDGPLSLSALAEQVGVSPFHLQRSFKALLGITPKEYTDACRVQTLKRELRGGRHVTDAQMEAGYGSSSRMYERGAPRLGMTPSDYRAGAPGRPIRFAVGDSPLGPVLVASTEKGVCAIEFGSTGEALRDWVQGEYPEADVAEDAGDVGQWLERVLCFLLGEYRELQVPLDIQATAFQRRVWNYLQQIPYGQTRSYSEVAEGIGQAGACRAVAQACASNRVALAIPCHRVVRADGEYGGYKWGADRKRRLLAREAESSD
jgi:AraC family transcriptional regulator of adaptative response/methylated-DNA-[protein]-cysteine methyltransferase